MPLEATMIVIDNSEYMRNGDYAPTRFVAQSDAVNMIFQAKIDSNPENTVGVMTMANKGPEVLVTHSKDLGQILGALHKTSTHLGGDVTLETAIAVAQLALKHRQNKNLRQRVVVFVGSPLEATADERALVRLAKRLKKNNVALDVIAFGDGIEESGEGGRSVLRAFVEAANSGDNSHYLAIPSGIGGLTDVLNGSSILAADRGIPEEAMAEAGPAAAGGAGGAGYEFGVDPNLDPELAMALRMSIEEEQARQAAVAPPQPEVSTAPPAPPAPVSVPPAAGAPPPAAVTSDEEEAALQQALSLSETRDVEMSEAGAQGQAGQAGEEEELTEEEMIARAIQMSMEGEEEKK